jgi:predicted nicotinamide N-methyase
MSGARLDNLAARFQIVCTAVPLAGRRLQVYHPRSADDLISQEDFDRDERLPYWADVWPSARVLAEHVVRLAGAGRRLLDLGCGAGLVGLAAAVAGFEVLAVDYYPEALEFVAANALANDLTRVATRHVDWRTWPADLGRFDVVAASDVLYELPHAGWVAAALASALAPAGLGLIADPGRRTAAEFAARCQEQGLTVATLARVPWTEGTARPTVELLGVSWSR